MIAVVSYETANYIKHFHLKDLYTLVEQHTMRKDRYLQRNLVQMRFMSCQWCLMLRRKDPSEGWNNICL